MNDLPLTETLARVWHEQATGLIKIKTGDRESKLLLERGDLVGADLRFGYQSLAQSLLLEGRIGLEELDALWARGAGNHLDRETLERLVSALRSPSPSDAVILQTTTRTSDVDTTKFSVSQGRTAGPTHNDKAKE